MTKTRQRPRNSFFGVLFLWMVRPYPFISVHICAYLFISVHICLYIYPYLSISVYICLYLNMSWRLLAGPYSFCDAIMGTAGCPPVDARHKG